MTDEKKPRRYRVLIPIPPKTDEFIEGRMLTYTAVGDFDGGSPDEAVQAAADAAAGASTLLGGDWSGGPMIAIPLTHWQMRDTEARTMRIWTVTRPERSTGSAAQAAEQAEAS